MIAAAADRTNPLFEDWSSYLQDPRAFWLGDAQTIAARARSLETDFPIVCAMVQTRLMGTHGPNGLQFTSHYQEDGDPDTSDRELATRRAIDQFIVEANPHVSADGSTRAQLEWELDRAAIIDGEGWAIRVWQDSPDSPVGSRWRQVNFWQIGNPKGEKNGPTLQDGIRLDANGRRVAIFVYSDTWTGFAGLNAGDGMWVPWRSADGMPNVIYRQGWKPRGGTRCWSCLTPMIFGLRMLQGLDGAYVATKRVHASHPLTIKVSDLKAARELYRGTKLANLLVDRDHDVTFNDFDFKGDDYTAYFNVQARNLMSSWGQPYELVLGDHSAKSGAASRSLWQQYYMRCHRWQDEHTHQTSRPIDEAIIREGAARGRLDLRADWHRALRGTYQRPPEPMPDPLKEIQSAQGRKDLGFSPTSVIASLGGNFQAETMQKAQDDAFAKAQGQTVAQAPVTSEEPGEEPIVIEDTADNDDQNPAGESTVTTAPPEDPKDPAAQETKP